MEVENDISQDEKDKIIYAFNFILGDSSSKNLASVPVDRLYDAMEPSGKLERFIYRK